MKNLTFGRPIKLIVLFALPLFAGNLFQQLYLIVDTLIVGRLLGVDALAGVGATGSIMFLVIGFCQAMTAGFSIVTAQHFGARNLDSVKRSFCVSLLLAVVVTIAITATMIFALHHILDWMNTPAEIYDHAYAFAHTIFLGIGAMVFYNLFANTILALGDAVPPLVFQIITSVVNAGLVLLFIMGFGMGVQGAALATVISMSFSALLCLGYIFLRLPVLRVGLASCRVTLAEVWRTFRIGLPMGAQISIIALGSIVLQSALNALGPTSVAAYTASMRIDFLAIMIFQSLGLAISTFTAQNFGARDLPRICQGVRETAFLSVALAIVVGGAIILFGQKLVALFVGPDAPEVVRLAGIFLTINGVSYSIVALLFIFRGTLQGLGQTLAPTLAGFMEMAMRGIAGPALIVPFGFAGACLSNPLAWIGALAPLVIVYFVSIRRLLRQHPERADADPAVPSRIPGG